MKDEEIIALAVSCNAMELGGSYIFDLSDIHALARAIADLQKEKDAQLCDRYAADYAVVGAGAYVYMEEGARSCAAGIRSPETDLDEWLRRQ